MQRRQGAARTGAEGPRSCIARPSGAGALARVLVVVALSASPSRVLADAPVVPGGVRVDGVAAVVGGTAPAAGVEVILRSDVELRARIAVSGRTERASLGAPLPPALLAATLDQIIGEALIAREAERVRVSSPNDADVERERQRLEDEAGGAARLRVLLARLGAGGAEVQAMARRRALVTAFLQANLEGTTVVTDAQVERAYEEGQHPFTDRPLEEVRGELQAWLSRRALDRAVRRWVSVLRARTPVRMMVQYD